MIRDDSFYQSLDRGIAATVRRLHELGFETTDSGDGTADMECAIGMPNVHVIAGREYNLVDLADEIHKHFPAWSIQAHYSPNDGIAGVMMMLEAGTAEEYDEEERRRTTN